MNILIAGDTVPTDLNSELFIDGDIKKILGEELYKIWNENEVKILNLETPFCERKNTIKKTGVCLNANPKCIKGIKALKPTLVCLANNHIMDCGKQGLYSTTNLLDECKINYIGVGENIQLLNKYYEINSETVCYNFCDIEFSGAKKDFPGTNTYSEFDTFDDIRNLKKTYKNIIVIFHGGKEEYRYATPKLQKICRKLIECGANIVVCQHSHCIGCYEKYENGHIVYGQGNFLFCKKDNEYWNTGMLIKYDSETNKISFIFYKRNKNSIIKIDESDEEYQKIVNDFNRRNELVCDSLKVEEKFKSYSNMNIERYLEDIRKKNIFFRIINKLFNHKLSYLLYDEKQLLNLLNDIQCEAHKEILIYGLKEKIFGGKDAK